MTKATDPATGAAPEHCLTLPEILGQLVADDFVDQADADALVAECRLKRLKAHPLTIVAEQKWKSRRAPYRPLTIDDLGERLAARVGLECFHIDPLKIDFTAVTVCLRAFKFERWCALNFARWR